MSLNEKTFNGAISACLEMGAILIQPPVTSKAAIQGWMAKVRAAFPEKFAIMDQCKFVYNKDIFCLIKIVILVADAHFLALSYIYIGYYTRGVEGEFHALQGNDVITRDGSETGLINHPKTDANNVALTIITKAGQSAAEQDTLDEAQGLDTQHRVFMCEKDPA